MKKLISIGVALAIVAMVVLPLGATAQGEYEGVQPDTYAKIPFAILESGLVLVVGILDSLASTLGLPPWLPTLVIDAAPWFGGPLSWTVDMLGWGIELLAEIMGVLTPLLGLPPELDVEGLLYTILCKLFTPFTCNVTGPALTLRVRSAPRKRAIMKCLLRFRGLIHLDCWLQFQQQWMRGWPGGQVVV